MRSHVKDTGHDRKGSGKVKTGFNGADVIRLTFSKALFFLKKGELIGGVGSEGKIEMEVREKCEVPG